MSAADAGGLLWKFKAGAVAARDTVGLLHNATTHTGTPANDGLADYIAPCRTHEAGKTVPTSKDVTLQLSIASGPSIGLGPELDFRIYKPTAHMTQVPASVPCIGNR